MRIQVSSYCKSGRCRTNHCYHRSGYSEEALPKQQTRYVVDYVAFNNLNFFLEKITFLIRFFSANNKSTKGKDWKQSTYSRLFICENV